MISLTALCVAKRCQDEPRAMTDAECGCNCHEKDRNSPACDVEGDCTPRHLPDAVQLPKPATRGRLCSSHYHRLERTLAELPALVGTVHRDFLAPGSGPAGDGSRPTKGNPPIPLSADTLDMLGHLEAVLASWASLIAEERGLCGPQRPQNAPAVSQWLLGHLDWSAGQQWIDDFETEVRDVVRPLRVLIGELVPFVRLDMACPYCAEQSLRARPDASSDVTCATEGCQDERGDRPRWTRQTWALLLSRCERESA